MWKTWGERLEEFAGLQIPVYAANACYFLAISIFPGLLLILASLRYTALSATDLIRLLEGILPGALMGAAESLIVSTYYNSSAGLVGVSALAALWSASRGIHGLLAGLNRIYGVREDRGWLYTRLICVGYTFVFLILAAEAIVWFQMRRLINSWEKEVEKEDMPLTDEEVHYVETRTKLMGILGFAALAIFLLRFVVFDLFPLIRG